MSKSTDISVRLTDKAMLLGEQLSENQYLSPEGYLICYNVPLARTGPQYYLGSEVGLVDHWHERVKIYREEEDVFDDEYLRSIESKPITEDHPPEDVTVSNAMYLSRGHGRNVRRGKKGPEGELVIQEASLIQKVRDKKKFQISLGYNCVLKKFKDGWKQTNIRVNHIAIVEVGRAGPGVAIKDEDPHVPVKKRSSKPMNKTQAMTKMFAAFVKDASEEDILAVMPFVQDSAEPAKPEGKASVADADVEKSGMAKLIDALVNRPTKAPEEVKPASVADSTGEKLDKVLDAITALDRRITDMEEKRVEDEDGDDVEKMLDSLFKDSDDEDDTTDVSDDASEEEKAAAASDSDDEDGDKAKANDTAAFLKALQPAINKLPKANRKAFRDAIGKQLRADKKGGTGSYSRIQEAVTKASAARDSQPQDMEAIGKNIAKSRNPHYQNK